MAVQLLFDISSRLKRMFRVPVPLDRLDWASKVRSPLYLPTSRGIETIEVSTEVAERIDVHDLSAESIDGPSFGCSGSLNLTIRGDVAQDEQVHQPLASQEVSCHENVNATLEAQYKTKLTCFWISQLSQLHSN
jgi:kynurenine formamidase